MGSRPNINGPGDFCAPGVPNLIASRHHRLDEHRVGGQVALLPELWNLCFADVNRQYLGFDLAAVEAVIRRRVGLNLNPLSPSPRESKNAA